MDNSALTAPLTVLETRQVYESLRQTAPPACGDPGYLLYWLTYRLLVYMSLHHHSEPERSGQRQICPAVILLTMNLGPKCSF